MKQMKKLLTSSFIAVMLISSLSIFLGVAPTYAQQEVVSSIVVPEASFWFAPSQKDARNGFGHYHDKVTPGETREYKFYVKNLLNKKNHLKIWATDPMPKLNGGIDFKSYNAGVTNAGTWVSPQGPKDITLGPQEMREYTYSVTVPKNIQPGQHIAVIGVSEYIAFQGKELETNIENATVAPDVANQYGIWIIMDYQIDKSKHSMSINTFTHDYIASGESEFTVTLENHGTILERPTGYLEIRDDSKKVIFRQDYEAGSIYAGSTANMVSIAQNQILLPGNYEAYFEANFEGQKEWKLFKFSVTPEEKNEAQAEMVHAGKLEVNDGIPDWLKYVLVIGGILILLLLILLLWLLAKRKKDDIEGRIKKYLEKGLTFEQTRKKVHLDEKTFSLYVVKLGYVPDGEEPEWDKTIFTSKHVRRIAIEMVEKSSAHIDSNREVSEGSASSETLKGGEDDVGKGA